MKIVCKTTFSFHLDRLSINTIDLMHKQEPVSEDLGEIYARREWKKRLLI